MINSMKINDIVEFIFKEDIYIGKLVYIIDARTPCYKFHMLLKNNKSYEDTGLEKEFSCLFIEVKKIWK